jgi:hypothetical protein
MILLYPDKIDHTVDGQADIESMKKGQLPYASELHSSAGSLADRVGR